MTDILFDFNPKVERQLIKLHTIRGSIRPSKLYFNRRFASPFEHLFGSTPKAITFGNTTIVMKMNDGQCHFFPKGRGFEIAFSKLIDRMMSHDLREYVIQALAPEQGENDD